MEKITTRMPIFDSQSNTLLLDSNSHGEIIEFDSVSDRKFTNFIVTKNSPEKELLRRLKYRVKFDGLPDLVLIYPDQFEFDEGIIGLISSLMKNEVILDVKNLTPTPKYQTEINFPYAITFSFVKSVYNFKITLIMDMVLGSMDVEIELDE